MIWLWPCSFLSPIPEGFISSVHGWTRFMVLSTLVSKTASTVGMEYHLSVIRDCLLLLPLTVTKVISINSASGLSIYSVFKLYLSIPHSLNNIPWLGYFFEPISWTEIYLSPWKTVHATVGVCKTQWHFIIINLHSKRALALQKFIAVRKEDAGEYYCRAKNDAGYAECPPQQMEICKCATDTSILCVKKPARSSRSL